MKESDLAGVYLYELYNVAEHVTRLTECARRAVEHGNFGDALHDLSQAQRSADSLIHRFRDALESLERANAETVTPPEGT